MKQDKVTETFFALMRAGLWDSPVDGSANLPLSDAEWDHIWHMAINQTVEALLFDGIQKLDPSFLPPQHRLLEWVVRVDKIERLNKEMNAVVAEQASFFEKHGVKPILLKGQGLASVYIRAKHRVCGDIDWYFPSKEAYEKGYEIIKDNHIPITKVAGYSATYWWGNCETDHHQHLFDMHNPFLKKYLKNLEREQADQHMHMTIVGQSITLPSPIEQLLQVNAHILKHLLSFGIGLRQLCDAARLYVVLKEKIDRDYLKNIYIKTGILKWITLLHKLLVDYIGMPKDSLPFEAKKEVSADWMMGEIWRAGNFGFHNAHYRDREETGRVSKKQRLWANFLKYVPYAPMEAISFPFVHYYSRLIK